MAVLMPNILSLRDDMRRKEWHIAIYSFDFNGHEKDIVTVRLSVRDKEPNPNAFYCYDVRPTGVRSDGTPKQRSIFNSNKTELRREKLYNKLKSEPRFFLYG